jgi:hypothetical protein
VQKVYLQPAPAIPFLCGCCGVLVELLKFAATRASTSHLKAVAKAKATGVKVDAVRMFRIAGAIRTSALCELFPSIHGVYEINKISLPLYLWCVMGARTVCGRFVC